MTTTSIETPLHIRILRTLIAAGYEAYLVGGYVRDTVLGRKSKDIEVATAATPDQVLALFPNSGLVGAHFGVVIVKDETATIEVATFRMDGVYSDGRHPDAVKFTTDVHEDMKRRDSTMNALYMDEGGTIYDDVGGIDDIRNGVVRAVGDPNTRYTEDALRMMRAIRQASQLDFSIEAKTFQAISQNVHLIHKVSIERIAPELDSILVSGNAVFGVALLIASGIMKLIIPEFVALAECPQDPKHHPEGNVLVHTLGVLNGLQKGCSLTLALGALLHDVGKPATLKFKEDGMPTAHGHEEAGAPIAQTILRRLKYPNDVVDAVVSHVAEHMRFRSVGEMRRSKLLRFLRQPNFAELLELHKLDCKAGSGIMEQAELVEKLLTDVPEEKMHPERLVTGADLITLGLKPGPAFKTILEDIETEQLEGNLIDREGAMLYLDQRVRAFLLNT